MIKELSFSAQDLALALVPLAIERAGMGPHVHCILTIDVLPPEFGERSIGIRMSVCSSLEELRSLQKAGEQKPGVHRLFDSTLSTVPQKPPSASS